MTLGANILVMTLSPSARRERVETDLREQGFDLEPTAWATLARDGPTDLTGIDAPLAVVPVTNSAPLTLVSAVASATHEGNVPILVVDQQTRDRARELFSAPFALDGEIGGRRQFHTVEDRIRLTDGSFACVAETGSFAWTERCGEDESPQLHLGVGGETVAVLDSIDALACPGPSPDAFRYRYERGSDGRFRVFEGSEAIGRYPGVTAMRNAGVRPVPLPLVPEHHVRSNGHLARATLLATVEDGTVEYIDCR
jgi:hypothetical protein